MANHLLKGSERAPFDGARSVGKADPAERFEVSIIVRRRSSDVLEKHVARLAAGDKSPGYIKREDFAKQFGADATDMDAVKTFADKHGLVVVEKHAARRTVVLSGTVAQFNTAFGVDLQQFEHRGGTYRGRTGQIQVPDELNGIVEAVLGLDNRPQARPHFRSRQLRGNVQWQALSTTPTSFTPTKLASLYNFPTGTGQNECIALIELGGGYRPADLNAYFTELGIATPPKVSVISIDHGKNHPTGDPNGPDGEVMLDIEVAGAIAPDAHVAVYFAPNTDAGFLDAVTTAIHDTTNKPSVISISWGGAESAWTQQSMTAFDQAFQAAAAMGITVCVASGDNGSSDGVADGADHVDFPASSPYALACGGTSVQASNGIIQSETVWNDGAGGGASGGGVSDFFALPAWQQGQQVTRAQNATSSLSMRGVPDVSGDADPATGYDVRVDGNDTVIGGTSAVAPLWAGLIARINSGRSTPVGYINPQLYSHAADLDGITDGSNGDFFASAKWNACAGLGRPDGQKLATVL
ncbi:protease pro-enzyme activation domain-containing protein [Burkholderia sp. BE17]|uniref:S53 family peptidase n=1 Tax=Burkholderia sp. BE17 TaxID=2656644 RepID=UPI00128E0014|nr:S53 family peptidase [Burkholderia sp. BE17]MPV71501.1 S8 family serine peptidase [Burkholderia sp. BE17]